MAKVVFEFMESSAFFDKKVIYLGEKQTCRIGRARSGEAVTSFNALFDNRVLSTNHAEMVYTAGQFFIKDSSKNGTFINGYKLIPNTFAQIESGDILELGTEVFFNSVLTPGIIVFVKLFPIEDPEENYISKIQEKYPFQLSFYKDLPLFNFNVEYLHKCSRERLKVLQICSRVGETRGEKWYGEVIQEMKNENLLEFCEMVMGTSVSNRKEYIQRRNDQVSHFMLLLACCRTRTTTRWFYRQELKLFQLRWHFLSETERTNFLEYSGLNLNKISNEEKNTIISLSDGFLVEEEDYFELDFQLVSEIVRSREVFVYLGKAFISRRQLIFYVLTMYLKELKSSVKIMKAKFSLIQYDERLRYLLEELKQGTKDYYDKINLYKKIPLSSIEPLSKKSFPLCMEILHRSLRRDHHLRNGGRFQYNNFLKCIGVTLEDAEKFWWQHFRQKMDSQEIIKKKYLYEFRHSYGWEGKRVSYPPMSCAKIMEKIPGPLEYHGCPFRIQSSEILFGTLIKKKGLKKEDAESIVETCEKGIPQMACSRYFEVVHGEPMSLPVVTHPHKYFLESQKIYSSRERGKKLNTEDHCSKESCNNCNSFSKSLIW